jgi:hypothetical protein
MYVSHRFACNGFSKIVKKNWFFNGSAHEKSCAVFALEDFLELFLLRSGCSQNDCGLFMGTNPEQQKENGSNEYETEHQTRNHGFLVRAFNAGNVWMFPNGKRGRTARSDAEGRYIEREISIPLRRDIRNSM